MNDLRLIPRNPSIAFEDRTLYFSNIDGQWWIAIKPICEVLAIKYEHQHEKLKADPILGQLSRNHGIVAADGRVRKMVCLPERYIYGWLFQIQSKNPKFLSFKQQCYDVLYDYFHGGLGSRKAAIREVALAKREMQRLRRELSEDERYKRMQELQGVVLTKGRELKQADRLLEQEQLLLFQGDEG